MFCGLAMRRSTGPVTLLWNARMSSTSRRTARARRRRASREALWPPKEVAMRGICRPPVRDRAPTGRDRLAWWGNKPHVGHYRISKRYRLSAIAWAPLYYRRSIFKIHDSEARHVRGYLLSAGSRSALSG
jgi:hypothetical protein